MPYGRSTTPRGILNLPSPRASHMHDGWIRYSGGDTFVDEFRVFENGKPKASETITYTRDEKHRSLTVAARKHGLATGLHHTAG